MSEVEVTDIKGVGPSYKTELHRMGYETAEDLLNADPRELQKDTEMFHIPRAEKIVSNAKKYFSNHWENMQYDPSKGYYDAGKNVWKSSDGKKTFYTESNYYAYEEKLRKSNKARVIAFDADKLRNVTGQEIQDVVYEAFNRTDNPESVEDEETSQN